MGSFRDQKGREWSLVVDLPLTFQVQDELGVDLLDPKAIADLSTNPRKFVSVLFLAFANQRKAIETAVADDAKTSGEIVESSDPARAFGRWATTVYPTLVEEWERALVSFFRSVGRAALANVVDKVREMRVAAETKLNSAANDPRVGEALSILTSRVDEGVETALDRIVRDARSFALAESAESIRERPSA